ncbi:hypothetical protein HK104_006431, partial [Borealophlyctis nickersoniae]
MPSKRLTIASYASQRTRSILLLPPNIANPFQYVLNFAKQKLRIKKPKRLFLEDGREILEHAEGGENVWEGLRDD